MRPYSIYFRLGERQVSIDWGRGALPQLGAAAYLTAKTQRVVNILEEAEDGNQAVAGVWRELRENTMNEAREMGVPFLESVVKGDNYSSDKKTLIGINRFIGNLQPFSALTRDIDIVIDGKKSYRTDQFGVGMLPVTQIFSDKGVITVDGFGLKNGQQRQWAENLRLPISLINRNDRVLTSENQATLQFIGETGYYRGSKMSAAKLISDKRYLGGLSPDELQKVLQKNNVKDVYRLSELYFNTWSENFLKNVRSKKNTSGESNVKETLVQLRKTRIDISNDISRIWDKNKSKQLEEVNGKITKIMSKLGGDTTTATKKKLGL